MGKIYDWRTLPLIWLFLSKRPPMLIITNAVKSVFRLIITLMAQNMWLTLMNVIGYLWELTKLLIITIFNIPT